NYRRSTSRTAARNRKGPSSSRRSDRRGSFHCWPKRLTDSPNSPLAEHAGKGARRQDWERGRFHKTRPKYWGGCAGRAAWTAARPRRLSFPDQSKRRIVPTSNSKPNQLKSLILRGRPWRKTRPPRIGPPFESNLNRDA